MAVDQREQGVVPADADVRARVPLGAALAHDDIAEVRKAGLAAELLHAEGAGPQNRDRCATIRLLSCAP